VKGIKVWENVTAETFQNEILPSNQPALLKGLVEHWPAVKASRTQEGIIPYLKKFTANTHCQFFVGQPEIEGRFYYTDDLKGFNFKGRRAPFLSLLDELLRYQNDERPPSFYAGSLSSFDYLPGFSQDNNISLVDKKVVPKIWIGNKTRIAAHYDIPRNIACVVSGKRRFTLFPTDQVKNLYIGPLDFTPAGQSLSLVDFHKPDFVKYPLFKKALENALVAELEAGDAIYIPSVWWHHVEGLDNINVLVNYWWRNEEAFMDSPLNSLIYSVLTIRDLPVAERRAWKDIFDHYVFQVNGDPMEHLPMDVRGIFSTITAENAKIIKDFLLKAMHQ
jgi:hypothetical protein